MSIVVNCVTEERAKTRLRCEDVNDTDTVIMMRYDVMRCDEESATKQPNTTTTKRDEVAT
jgi:hypothetical protein